MNPGSVSDYINTALAGHRLAQYWQFNLEQWSLPVRSFNYQSPLFFSATPTRRTPTTTQISPSWLPSLNLLDFIPVTNLLPPTPSKTSSEATGRWTALPKSLLRRVWKSWLQPRRYSSHGACLCNMFDIPSLVFSRRRFHLLSGIEAEKLCLILVFVQYVYTGAVARVQTVWSAS